MTMINAIDDDSATIHGDFHISHRGLAGGWR